MTIYLVRHAQAGSRADWDGDDRLRPLTSRGQLQAAALVRQLHNAKFDRIVSSPYTRCMETVVPIAAAHMLALTPHAALAEGAPLEDALALVNDTAVRGGILCSHGDVIPDLLGHWRADGLDLGTDPACQKGSTWIVELDDVGAPTSARYLAPPDR